MRTEVCLDRK